VLIGILIYTAGLFASSFVPKESYWVMYVTYSGLVSFGGGFIYTCAISCAKKWWPEKQGFAGGFIVSMLGASTLVLTPLITAAAEQSVHCVSAYLPYSRTVFFVVLALVYGFMRFPKTLPKMRPRAYTAEKRPCGSSAASPITCF
jgi:OFA family oxalate/formate antiporter-like MFS transporter